MSAQASGQDSKIIIRPATPADAGLIFAFVSELAAFEHLSHEVQADESGLKAALFGANPRVFAEIAEYDGAPAGFILWFYTFSSFVGRHGIWIEDLYVRQEFRGKGLGAVLLHGIARRCVAEKLGRLEWSVLNWNENAIRFYQGAGAQLKSEWTICRMEGAALAEFSAEDQRA
ncbi:MAG: N-acetyltransferase family protein [Beijerinckiaceae bacterium]